MPCDTSRVTSSSENGRPADGISALPGSVAKTVWYIEPGHDCGTYPYRIGNPYRPRYSTTGQGSCSAAIHSRDGASSASISGYGASNVTRPAAGSCNVVPARGS